MELQDRQHGIAEHSSRVVVVTIVGAVLYVVLCTSSISPLKCACGWLLSWIAPISSGVRRSLAWSPSRCVPASVPLMYSLLRPLPYDAYAHGEAARVSDAARELVQRDATCQVVG